MKNKKANIKETKIGCPVAFRKKIIFAPKTPKIAPEAPADKRSGPANKLSRLPAKPEEK